jgi:hypothetical protein
LTAFDGASTEKRSLTAAATAACNRMIVDGSYEQVYARTEEALVNTGV